MNYKTYYFGKDKEIEIILLEKANSDGMIGMVNSKISHKETIGLHIASSEGSNYITFASLYISSYHSQPMISISKEVYNQCNGLCSLLSTIIFHELGHYKLGHCENVNMSNDEIRIKAVKQGKVAEREHCADQFAVSYLGSRTVIEGLRKLKSIPLEIDPNNIDLLYSNKEIDLRIKAILEK